MGHRWARRFRDPADADRDRGFTLIELIVSLTILAIVVTAMAASLESAMGVTRNNRNRVIASALAAQAIDVARSTPFGNLQTGRTTTTTTVGPVGYTIIQDVTPSAPPDTPTDACDYSASGSNDHYLVVDVSVSWPDMAGATAAQASTMIAPPATVITAGLGTVVLQVVGPDGPESGVPVILTSTGKTVVTTANGCAPFTGLSPLAPLQTYTFTADNYIDTTQTLNPKFTLTALTAGQTVEQQEQWALPATLTVNIAVPSGAETGTPVAPTQGVGYALSNNLIDPAPTGSSFRVYPYGSYQAWAGDCSDAGTQTGEDLTSISASPGSAAVGSVALYPVVVKPTDKVRAGSTTITVTHVTQPGGSCPDGTTPQFTFTGPAAAIPPPPTTTTTSTTTTTTVPATTTTSRPSTTTTSAATTTTTVPAPTTTTTTKPLAPPPVLALPAGQWKIDWGGCSATVTVAGSTQVSLTSCAS